MSKEWFLIYTVGSMRNLSYNLKHIDDYTYDMFNGDEILKLKTVAAKSELIQELYK